MCTCIFTERMASVSGCEILKEAAKILVDEILWSKIPKPMSLAFFFSIDSIFIFTMTGK